MELSSNAGDFSVDVVELSDVFNAMDAEVDDNNSENDNNEQLCDEEEKESKSNFIKSN